MIGCIFQFANEFIEARVVGNQLLFRTAQTGLNFYPLECIKFDYRGTMLEFPDLKDNDDWQKIALERMKEKLKTFETEELKLDYVIEELAKKGYVPKYKQRAGFRPEIIK